MQINKNLCLLGGGPINTRKNKLVTRPCQRKLPSICGEPPGTGGIQSQTGHCGAHWGCGESNCPILQQLSIPSPCLVFPSFLPEASFFELLDIKLDFLLSSNLAEAGIFWGVHKESPCTKTPMSSPAVGRMVLKLVLPAQAAPSELGMKGLHVFMSVHLPSLH